MRWRVSPIPDLSKSPPRRCLLEVFVPDVKLLSDSCVGASMTEFRLHRSSV